MSTPGSPRTLGPGLLSSAREMDTSINLTIHVPAQPPALPSHQGKERVLLSLHPPPCGGLRANKKQRRNHTRKSSLGLTTSHCSCSPLHQTGVFLGSGEQTAHGRQSKPMLRCACMETQ